MAMTVLTVASAATVAVTAAVAMVAAPTAAVPANELKWGAEMMLGAAIILKFVQMEIVSGGNGISIFF